MKKIIIEIEISEEAFELLKKLEKGGMLEYRDSEFKNLDEFKQSIKNADVMDINRFLLRNEDGTLYLAEELDKHGFIEDVNGSWHRSYRISDLGREILNKNKDNDDYICCPNCGRIKIES